MNDPTITIQALTSINKGTASASKLVAQAYYYEWNDRDKIWTKLIAADPEPPVMPDGKFDGQIVEVRKA
jgi:hypothetical protein